MILVYSLLLSANLIGNTVKTALSDDSIQIINLYDGYWSFTSTVKLRSDWRNCI